MTGCEFGAARLPNQAGSGSAGGSSVQKRICEPTPAHVLIMEAGVDENGEPLLQTHIQHVREVYDRNAPDTSGNVYYRAIDLSTSKIPSNLSSRDQRLTALNAKIDDVSTILLRQTSQALREEAEAGRVRVINGSYGTTRISIYKEVLQYLHSHPEIAAEIGLDQNDLECITIDLEGSFRNASQRVAKKVASFVDGRLDEKGSTFQLALKDYQTATRQAAEKGIIPIFAVHNHAQERQQHFPNSKPGADFNVLAMSDHVISVAASDEQGTPNDTSDDTIASFSSRGNNRFKPTIATTGVKVQFQDGSVGNGTSYASPKVEGTVDLMLEANPNLTFEQVKSILQRTATDTKAPAEAEGAGMLNATTAIKKARNFRTQQAKKPNAFRKAVSQ